MKSIDEEHIIRNLQNMPHVEDEQTIDEWTKRIKPYMYQRSRVKKKRSKMIPIFSTALAIAIMFLILPSVFKNPSSSLEQPMTSSTNGSDEQVASEDRSNDEFNYDKYEMHPGEHVLNDVPDDSRIVYSGTFDQQTQYMIPLTFITEKKGSLSNSYNEINTYMDHLGSTIEIPYFENMQFEIDEDEKNVNIKTAADYSIGEGSAVQGKFEEMLSYMFYSYGIEQIGIENEEGGPASLGEIGEVSEINIEKPAPANFKYYYHEDYERSFLIPIEQYEISFADAILDLKNAEESFSVTETIPSDLEVWIDCSSNEVCTIDLQGDVDNMSDEELTLAIESILMTAKRYGYRAIEFKGLSQASLNGYDMTEPIEVPISVNPIQMHK